VPVTEEGTGASSRAAVVPVDALNAHEMEMECVQVDNPMLARTQSAVFDGGDDSGGGPEEAESKAVGSEDISSTSWTKTLRCEEKALRAKDEEFGLDTAEKARLKFLTRVKRKKKRSDSKRRLIAGESSDKADVDL
jgi:hypothetical protein